MLNSNMFRHKFEGHSTKVPLVHSPSIVFPMCILLLLLCLSHSNAAEQKDLIGVYEVSSWVSLYDNGVIVYSSQTTGLYGRVVLSNDLMIFTMIYYLNGVKYVDTEFGAYTFGANNIGFSGKLFGYQSLPYSFSSPNLTVNHRSYDSSYNYRTVTMYLKKLSSIYSQSDLDAAILLATSNMYTQAQLTQAVQNAEALKDQIIAQRNQTISDLNLNIASKDSTISTLNQTIATKDQSISTLNATIAAMFTKEQLDEAIRLAEVSKDVVIAQKEEVINSLNVMIEELNALIVAKDHTISTLSDLDGDGKLDLVDIIWGLQVLCKQR